MLWSAPGMIVGLTLAAVAFHCACSYSHSDLCSHITLGLVMTEHTGNVLVTGAHYSQTWSAIVLLSMIIFVASYASGLGNVPWQQGELFGLEGVYRVTLALIRVDPLISSPARSPLGPFYFPGPMFLPSSPRYRHLPRDSHQLECEPRHQLDLPLAHGPNHPFRGIRILRRALSARVRLLRVLFPRDGWVEFGRGEVGVRGWVWASAE